MILATGRPSPLGQFFSHSSSSPVLEKCWTGLFFTVLEGTSEDIGTAADVRGQWVSRNGIGFGLLRFDQPLLARATFHGSLNKSLSLVWWQILGGLSGGRANANGNSGCSQTGPVYILGTAIALR
jgi:hypothetical protein